MKLPAALAKIASRLAGQASPLVVGRLASAALTFALPLWLARVLDPAGFGSYKQLFLVVQTVQLTCQLGLTQSLYYFLPGGGPRRGAFLTQVLLGLVVLSAIAGGVLFAAAPWIGAHLGDGSLIALRLPLALVATTFLVASPLEGALTSEGRLGAAALAYIASDATRAAFLVGGALHGGIAGIAWAAVLYGLLRVVALGVLMIAGVLPSARPSWPDMRRQLAYALPFAGSVWLYVAQSQFAQYTVAATFDAASFALYSVAMFHLPVVDILYTPVTEVLMVRLGQRRAEGAAAARVELNDALDKLASIVWPAAACAWLFGPELLPILFTGKYDGAVRLFLIATLLLPISVLPVDAVLRAAGDTRFLFAWSAARAAITGGLVCLGIHVGGLSGAIAGVVASELCSRLVMLVRARRFLGGSVLRALDLRQLATIAIASAVAALPAWLARFVTASRGRIVLGAAVYGAAYLVLRLTLIRRARTDAVPSLAELADDATAREVATAV